jgi:hypothetical protein
MILAVINISVLIYLFFPKIKQYMLLWTVFDMFYKNWTDKCNFLRIVLYQWFNKCIVKTEKDTYDLVHVIDGKLVKITIEKIYPEIIDVEDFETGCSLYEESRYLYKQVDHFPSVKSIIYFDDGETEIID